jgi:drug/metabolite transporter (DMT)-like permease
MSPTEEALAKKRFFAINVMRVMGIAFLMAGFILIAGRWELAGQPTDRYLGIALVLIGAFDFAVFPMLLARRWRSPRDL